MQYNNETEKSVALHHILDLYMGVPYGNIGLSVLSAGFIVYSASAQANSTVTIPFNSSVFVWVHCVVLNLLKGTKSHCS